MIPRARGVGPIVCYVETQPCERSVWTSACEAPGAVERLASARRWPPLLAAGFSGHPGHDSVGVLPQADLPGLERREDAHFRAVFARDGPVQREGGLVGPAAIPAVPASRSRLHNAPIRPTSDFKLDATRLRRRESARPQSPAPEAVVVVLPTDSRWSVVQ
jgi:hypothetical protein